MLNPKSWKKADKNEMLENGFWIKDFGYGILDKNLLYVLSASFVFSVRNISESALSKTKEN